MVENQIVTRRSIIVIDVANEISIPLSVKKFTVVISVNPTLPGNNDIAPKSIDA
jgi:hypothetical protein